MNNYDYTAKLTSIWDKAVKLYAKGQRGSGTYFEEPEALFLKQIGITAQEVYDFAEDFNAGGEPDFATFIAIHDVRRAYFLEVQQGEYSGNELDSAALPGRDAEAEGIRWLPRLIVKAKAKLRGELNPDIMYGCGGDRNFFRARDIHPAEFLRVVWASGDDDAAIVAWVLARK